MPLTSPAGIPQQLRLPRGFLAPSPGSPAPLTIPAVLVAAPAFLPGNLISPADSDFEGTLAGTNWGTANCSLAVSAARSFSGAQSLAVTATAAGNVTITQNLIFPFAGRPSAGYVVSGYAWTPNSGRTGQAQVKCVNAGFTTGSDLGGPVTGLQAGTWTPLQGAITSPGFTAWVAPEFTFTGMQAGETIWIDLAYGAPSGVQVLVAWQTQPGNTSPLFSDMTPFTRADQPIAMTRGRQDNLSEVQAGQLTLTMSNDAGWLTEQNTASPFYPNVKLGRRIQVSLADENGTWHTRFDGQVNDIELAPAPTGLQADALIQAGDVMAYLARQQGLHPWTKEEIFLDSPALHWTLDDPAGSSVAVESSGNQGPPLQLHSYGTAGTYAFAGGTASANGVQNGMESQTWTNIGTPAAFPAVYFRQQAAGSNPATQQQNWQLQAGIPLIQTGAGQNTTIEAFLIPDVPNNSLYTTSFINFNAVGLSDTRSGTMTVIWVSGAATPKLNVSTWQGYLNANSTVFSPLVGPVWNGGTAGPVGVALVITGSNTAPTAVFYVNGVSQGTVNLPAGTVFNYLTVGGPIGGYQGWLGQISCVSIWNSALPSGRLLAHSQKASAGAYAQTPGRILRSIASYAGVPAFWASLNGNLGLSGIDYFSIAGQNALTAMQSVEQADGGVLYANAAGQLSYAGREARMGAGPPVLTLQAGQYEPDLGYKMNDQFLSNQAGFSSAGISTGIPAANTQSQADFGVYAPNGTAQSPTSVPLLTYNNWAQANLNGAGGIVNAFAPDNLLFAAQWAANSRAQPSPKGASVRVDMLTIPQPAPGTYADQYTALYADTYGVLQPGAAGLARSALYALEVGSVIALAGLPSAFPNTAHASEYFVEGVSETIQGGAAPVRDIVFYTSPASQGRAWIPGDPVYGKLDSTAVIGRSAAPNPPAVPAFEFAGSVFPGPPYYPPAYGTGMNVTAGGSTLGFAGDLDQAGIWYNLQQQLRPPMGIAAVTAAAQSIGNAASGPPANSVRLVWDTVYADTLGGFGWLTGWPNWYFTLVPGWWQLFAVANFATNGTGRRAAWFLVGQRAARNGTGPVSGLNNIGSAEVQANGNFPTGVAISAKIYCTLGTAIAVQVWQNSGGSLSTATPQGGCLFAARFLGDTTVQD